MTALVTSSSTTTPAIRDHDAGRDRSSRRSWVWALVEALAYAGATIDPSAALAARRLAQIRDQELGHRPR